MLLVLLSPAFQMAGIKTNLFDIAINEEEKLTLWWAAAVAAVNLIWRLL